MNPSDAEAIALQHMANQIKLHYCPSERVPTTFYNFNADQYHIFSVEDSHNLGVGGSRYVAVNKVDGSIRDLGLHGE
jgi:hypothetical protein